MDDKTQKERLEQELRFLKESFEAEVISKEEYDKGKERIEKKLNEIESAKIQTSSVFLPDETTTEAREAEEVSSKEIKEEAEEELAETQQVEQKVEAKELPKEPTLETPKTEIKDEKSLEKNFSKRKIFLLSIFIILVLVVFFSYSLFKNKPQSEEIKEAKFIEFKEIPKINVLVLNDRNNCFNCDPQRILNILDKWFGEMRIKEIDYNKDEGKKLAERFNASMLPMYVLDENITKKPAFEQFKQIFVKKDNKYILSEDAAGSTFYFKRDNVPNKLDLFVISSNNISIKAEKNLKEFLEVFKEVKFDKYLSNDKLTKELGIKTFPVFLVNNRIKFSGTHTAETIKDNFCKLNKVTACEKSLSKSLV